MAGVPIKSSINANQSRVDFLDLSHWGRAVMQDIDFYDVGGQTVFLSLGTGSTLTENATKTQFIMPFVIQALDSAGNPVTGATKNVYTFKGPQFVQPYEGLVFDAAGNLYSSSYVGGGNCENGGCGFIYELSPGANHWTSILLANLNGGNGAYPIGGVALDREGNAYGTASSGGSSKDGVVFQIIP